MKAYTEDARDPGYKPPVRFAAYLSDQAHDPAAFTQMPTPLGVFPRIQPPPPDQGEHDYFPGEADRNLFDIGPSMRKESDRIREMLRKGMKEEEATP